MLTYAEDMPPRPRGIAWAQQRLDRRGHRDPAIIVTGASGTEAVGPIDVRWEIGSITKVFTAVLLARLHLAGALDMSEPIAPVLPASVTMPPGAGSITFEHLATHRSGLPRLPPGIRLFGRDAMADPYAIFDEARILRALEETRLRRTPGTGRPRYSNFGFGLLGFAMAMAVGRPYEQMVMDEVIAPLGLASATFGDEGLRTGRSRKREVGPWHLGDLSGMGGLRMSPADLARFLHLSQQPGHELAPAFAESFRLRYRGRRASIGLGWMYLERERVRGHNGGTLGAMTEAFADVVSGDHVVVCGDGNPGTMGVALALLREQMRQP